MLAPLVLVLIAAAVFFLGVVTSGVLSRAYQRYRERYVEVAIEDLGTLFLFVEPKQVMVLNLCSMFLLGAAGWLLIHPLAGALATAAGFFLPSLAIRFSRKRRIKRFDSQLVEALQAMAGAMRAGLTFPQAMEHVSKDAQAPLSQEFGLFVKEIKLGVPIEVALLGMGARVGSEELELVVVSTNIARSLGGNLAEMFETIASTLRERFRLEAKIDAVTSQGKLQGWVVAAMPFALGLVLNFMRPDLMGPMLHHPFGYVLAGCICILELLGALWIRWIARIEV